MCMIRGKCACFRAKMVYIPGHLPIQAPRDQLSAHIEELTTNFALEPEKER